jgi:hypothetical protein
MHSREFFFHQGRTWFVHARPSVRKGEVDTHVTLELMTDNDSRVVSCRREEWDVREPDFAELLARSVASGASRHVVPKADPDASPTGT